MLKRPLKLEQTFKLLIHNAYTDLYLSPAESPNFGVQEKPLTFMLSKHFWRFTSLNLNTLIRHL